MEDQGQEGMELAFNKRSWPASAGSRRVIKDRLGRVVEGVGERGAARSTGRTCSCPSTARCSSLPTRSCATAVTEHKAKAGSVVVLDAHTGEVLALANYPSYDPGRPPQPDRASSCATAP